MKWPALSTWLRVHPNAAMAPLGRGRWYPLFHLVWLFWMVSAPWYVQGGSHTRIMVLTFFSLAIFLPLHYRAWYGDSRRIVWNTAAIAVLGLVMIPVNTCWSYVIYASVLIPYCTTPKTAMAWLGALMVAFAGVATWVGFPVQVTIAAIAMCVVLSLINLIGRVNHLHDAELRLSHDEVRRLAATAERERIGRDLHDLLGHTLSLITVKSELARRLFDRDGDGARREIAEIERIAREALAQVRSAVTGIRAAGIAAELASARMLLESSGIALDYRSDDLPLAADSESALALCLREAVTNVQRHARATRVTVTLVREGRMAVLTIVDDGRGGAKARGNGLTGIEERLVALGGRSTLASGEGGGTRLELRVPIDTNAAPHFAARLAA
jgi:two-component system sensor histidine kinase DesK